MAMHSMSGNSRCGNHPGHAVCGFQRLQPFFYARPFRPQRLSAEACGDSDLPPELQGLRINEQGLLIDGKTGEVINEMTGATRFDVATRAIRGEFDPAPGTANTERSSALLESLLQFPTTYQFQFVARPGPEDTQEGLVEELRALVGRVCAVDLPLEQCEVKARMGGKYLSISIPATVRAAEFVERVFKECEGDTRLLMKY